ncbi:subclass B1 metallo-beta-lactamase [Flavobacteriaceae bacterium F08102]|nr:subclass B1 metallo-beta-lactamase [Flavobacteriaceae bacterium F08102]
MKIFRCPCFLLFSLLLIQCKKNSTSAPLYQSEHLIINQVSPNCYVHISYLQTDDFGRVACNGLIVLNQQEALIIDTPTDSLVSTELIEWIEKVQHSKINGVVVSHFHEDCLGGLATFHSHGIPSYANELTAQLAQKANYPIPQNLFKKRLDLQLGTTGVVNQFFGKGHTSDNIVSYFPLDKVLFGGCLIKSMNASRGFLGDANLKEWSKTIALVKEAFPSAQTTIPGHGATGSRELLSYTETLFNPSKGE